MVPVQEAVRQDAETLSYVGPPETTPKSDAERRALLGRTIANHAGQGYRVESQSDYQAFLVKGHRPNHLLHAIISILTLVWFIGWIVVAIQGGEERKMVEVDPYGNVIVAQL